MTEDAQRVVDEDLEHFLEHAGEGLTRVRGSRIFITGGTGFIGSSLLDLLAGANRRRNLGLQLVTLSRDPVRFNRRRPRLAADEAVQVLQGDVRTFPLPAGSFDHVVHAATDNQPYADDASRRELLDTVVNGTRRVIHLAERAGAENLLLISSGAVYGAGAAELDVIPETCPLAPDPTAPESAYAEAKRVAELLCVVSATSALKPKIARGFAFIGPNLDLEGHQAIACFLKDAVSGRSIEVRGDGAAVRSYLHTADLAIWLLKILLDGKSSRAYNVGSSEAVDLASLARIIAECVRRESGVNVTGLRVPAAKSRYVPSIRRAQEELGLGVLIPLRQGVRRTLAHLIAA